MRLAIVGRTALAAFVLLAAPTGCPSAALAQLGVADAWVEPVAIRFDDVAVGSSMERPAFLFTRARLDADFAAMHTFRPGHAFWRHIFTIPDGRVAFGSAADGRLLVTFPAGGNWERGARWEDPWLANALEGQRLESGLNRRRDQVASLLEASAGPLVHNPTRGDFLLPNARRYGGFLSEWGAIYQRFGVPPEIGLAQAVVESGLNGKVRSEASALGFCQWLPENWNRLKRLAHHAIEGYNQTTQAPYCAAYLTILATKYGSFIPALSEHHAGGTNVARVVITGGRLGGRDARERYLLGSELVRELREISPRAYRDVYASYGPRSFLYAEMVFGNTVNVTELEAATPQREIHAMRTARALSLSEITRRTGLSAEEVRRFNPALVRQVPAGANLYLPSYVEEFGADVAFWRRPATYDYAAALDDFVRLEATVEEWHDPAFRHVLEDFRRRFEATETEEGLVMGTALAYVIEETYRGRRTQILADYVNSDRILGLFERGVSEREALRREAVAVQ